MKIEAIFTFVIVILWGLWAFLGKLASGRIGYQSVFWIYLSGVAVIMIHLIWIAKVFPLKSDFRGIVLAVLSGVTIALGSIIFWWLIQKKPAGVFVIITGLYPFITLLLSIIFLGERLSAIKLFGVFFALVALVLLNL